MIPLALVPLALVPLAHRLHNQHFSQLGVSSRSSVCSFAAAQCVVQFDLSNDSEIVFFCLKVV